MTKTMCRNLGLRAFKKNYRDLEVNWIKMRVFAVRCITQLILGLRYLKRLNRIAGETAPFIIYTVQKRVLQCLICDNVKIVVDLDQYTFMYKRTSRTDQNSSTQSLTDDWGLTATRQACLYPPKAMTGQ